MLTANDRLALRDNIEYRLKLSKGENPGEINWSNIFNGRGSISMDSARNQNEKGGINIVTIETLKTNINLPVGTQVRLKGDSGFYKIDVCYRKASRLSGLYYYHVTRV